MQTCATLNLPQICPGREKINAQTKAGFQQSNAPQRGCASRQIATFDEHCLRLPPGAAAAAKDVTKLGGDYAALFIYLPARSFDRNGLHGITCHQPAN